MPLVTEISGGTLFCGGIMLHPHLASTVPTPDDPLQQRGALAGHAPTPVPLPVLAQLFLSLHELLPTHIGRMMLQEQHRPLGPRAQAGPRLACLGRARISLILPPPIAISPSIAPIPHHPNTGAQRRLL